MLPPQGFRHAVDLLLKHRARRRDRDADQLARELVALGEDMKAPPEFAAWVIEEYERVFQQPAPALLRALGGTPAREPERRELFLIYVPEDRLPIAAPLAVELAKRRVSVAFSEYEVESATQLTTALERGRHVHRAGAVLVTPAFLHRGLPEPAPDDRLAVLGHTTLLPAQAEGLILWLSKIHTKSADF
jgi:hypothetical protein